MNIRELSLDVLMKVLEKGEYSSVVLPQVLSNYQYLEKQERAFFTRLTEGTMERAVELDYVINQFSKTKVKKMKPLIRTLLRMGVYQILYMEQVPDRAACNESVKLAQKRGFHQLKGFVNGVLRNIARNKNQLEYPNPQKERQLYLQVKYSMPEWIVALWLEQYGEELTETMLAAMFTERKTSIRCQLQNASVAQVVESLQEQKVTVEAGAYVDAALQISAYDYLQQLEAFQKGWFVVQDESSMLVALASQVKEESFVVDVCSAPGGKSMHMADLMQGTGQISARDLSLHKIQKIEENCRRLGIHNLTTKVQDGTILDESILEQADVVIADVPCSGLGVMGKKNDIKYKASKEGMEQLVALQRQIVSNAVKYLKPGGILMYSTCTVNKKENQENVKWIVEEFGLTLESLDSGIPESLQSDTTAQGFLQLYPGIHSTDGFFLAKLKK